jgi:hypothetical protein
MAIPKTRKMTEIGVFKEISEGEGFAIVNVLRPRTEDVRGWNGVFGWEGLLFVQSPIIH